MLSCFSRGRLFATPGTVAFQSPLSFVCSLQQIFPIILALSWKELFSLRFKLHSYWQLTPLIFCSCGSLSWNHLSFELLNCFPSIAYWIAASDVFECVLFFFLRDRTGALIIRFVLSCSFSDLSKEEDHIYCVVLFSRWDPGTVASLSGLDFFYYVTIPFSPPSFFIFIIWSLELSKIFCWMSVLKVPWDYSILSCA